MNMPWEFVLLGSLTALLALYLVLRLIFLWRDDQRRWHATPRYYGSEYNQWDKTYRPNIRRVV